MYMRERMRERCMYMCVCVCLIQSSVSIHLFNIYCILPLLKHDFTEVFNYNIEM